MRPHSHLRLLFTPGIYRVQLGCSLVPGWEKTLYQEGYTARLVMEHNRLSTLFVEAQDQAEILAALDYLHGLGIPLLSLTYEGEPDSNAEPAGEE
jgi:hypothetical protein